jgi:release factor glutamine methyltransferase
VLDVVGRLRAAGCVFAEDEAALLAEAAGSDAELEALVDRRVAGEPLEHLLGWAEFAGLRIVVAPGVFVPRRRTELLAREALAVARPGGVLVELCCGAGAIAAAVRAAVPELGVYAVELVPVAAECARRNLPGAQVLVGDLYGPLPASLRGHVDALVANAPYVPSEAIATMPPEAREHEPRRALDGGADGLAVLRRVAAGATGWLAPGGALIVEAGRAQAPVLVAEMARAGLAARLVRDEQLDATAVVATPVCTHPAR